MDHFRQFMGRTLGCTDGTVATYAGDTMEDSHSFMTINNAQFVYLKNLILGSMDRALGVTRVTPEDLVATNMVLETYRMGICNAPDCNTTRASGPPIGIASSSTSTA